MKKALTFTTLVLCAALLAGTSWAGPCAGGANPGPGVNCRGANLQGADLRGAIWVDGRRCQEYSFGECRH